MFEIWKIPTELSRKGYCKEIFNDEYHFSSNICSINQLYLSSYVTEINCLSEHDNDIWFIEEPVEGLSYPPVRLSKQRWKQLIEMKYDSLPSCLHIKKFFFYHSILLLADVASKGNKKNFNYIQIAVGWYSGGFKINFLNKFYRTSRSALEDKCKLLYDVSYYDMTKPH